MLVILVELVVNVSLIKMVKPTAKWTWDKAIAQSAGAYLGFKGNGLPGAYLGYSTMGKAYDWQRERDDSGKGVSPQKVQKYISSVIPKPTLTKKKMAKKSVQSTLVNRSAMKVTGKTKLKKTKNVKVSAKFRQGVKKVLEGQGARGTYITVKGGMVGSLCFSGGGGFTISDMGGTQAGLYGCGANQPAGARTLWSALGTWGLATNVNLRAQTAMTYFTPAKILDAASVLFNSKSLGDPYLTTNNLTTVQSNSAGAPNVGRPGTLKINVLDSYVNYTLKNVSNRVVTMDIWECTPKLKFQVSNALDSLSNTYGFLSDVVDDHPVGHYTGVTTGTADYLMFTESRTDPLGVAAKYLGYQWTWKKRSMILAPDETCVHSIKGPRGELDFSKLKTTPDRAVAPVEQLNVLLKGWSISVIMSVRGDQVLNPTSTGWLGQPVAYYSGTTENQFVAMPVAVEIQEGYRIGVPEVAGFMASTGIGAGTSQMLNLRKPKFVLWNQVETNGTASNFVVSNEVNPTAKTLAGDAQKS